MSVEVMFFADAGCQVMHPEIPDVDDYIDEIVYPASATPRLDSTDIRTVISEQSESESESEESSTIKVEPTSGDEEFTSDASVPRTSIVDSCANYDDGPKDPDKNQKERERNLRKGESLRLLRQKIMESGIDCECIGDEKKMTEEVTLKLTIQLIQHLRFLIRQRGGNLANCKFAVPLANRRYPEIHFRRLGYSQPPKKRQNCYIKFTQAMRPWYKEILKEHYQKKGLVSRNGEVCVNNRKVINLMARVWNRLSKKEKQRDVSSLTEKEMKELVELGELELVSNPQAASVN